MSNATFLLDPATGQRYRAGGSSDANGNTTVVGNSASGASDSGAPVKVGGVYNSALPTLTDGQRGNLQMDSRGGTYVVIKGPDVVGAAAVGTGSDGLAASTIGLTTRNLNQVYNGTGWDRMRGDTSGLYTVEGIRPAATDRSGTATTTSGVLAAANASRRGLEIQNIGANNIGVNEFGGTAAIGTPGTYTVVPNGFLKVRTNRAVNVIAATASTAFTATEY